MQQRLEEEKEARAAENPDGVTREALITEYKEKAAAGHHLKEEIRQYEKCDPEKLELIKKKVQTCKEASVRWTDNLFELESWMKK